ncbi:MAG: N-acetylmuramoyl-L-alanine amidase [Bacteroidales bacterium]|nr:N-acetylmuramoyl-L-alanine amidase [Bacteroidales bacterium]
MNYLLPESQYVNEVSDKKQIVLHHTVSGDGFLGDVQWWKTTPERIATAYLITRNGEIVNIFPDDKWAYHLGLKSSVFSKISLRYQNLDKSSIGIELDSWGALERKNGFFYPVGNVTKYPVRYPYEYCSGGTWRGFQFCERYTTPQLAALSDLLRTLCQRYNIPKTYSDAIWDSPCRDALRGVPGIYAHASFRADKSDVHPQIELLNTLKKL